MGLEPEFEAFRTRILNTTPLPSLFKAFAIVEGDERQRRILFPPPVIGHSPPIPYQMAFATCSGLRPTFGAPSSPHPTSGAPLGPRFASTRPYC